MMFQQILAALQSLKQNQGAQQNNDVNMKLHPVTSVDENGNRAQIKKTLPQIITDLDLSIQDLTELLDELIDSFYEESKRKRRKRSNRIRAKRA